jgi:hypothetical protein
MRRARPRSYVFLKEKTSRPVQANRRDAEKGAFMRRLLVTASLVALGISFGSAGPASAMVARMDSGAAPSSTNQTSALSADVVAARLATAKYATNLALAKANGYQIITRMFPDMGYHFMNPAVKAFDVTRPPILVYEHTASGWQLGALEWVFTSKPATPPLPGAKYGTFGAACHYVDGTFVYASSKSKCAPTSPQTGAKFNFWHPNLVTLHFWVWYPNSAGIYSSMNPLVARFNAS